ncbi:hypothetical protein [Floridanema evergladense]|uniref:Uncharacterized protein n=1 Tax=Floridaenema evergladense BLCC-F167 TaxID=3153639 RepID=A0ABV4WD06_9CYAN
MLTSQANEGGFLKQILIAALFVGGLCAVVVAFSFFIEKYHNDEVVRLRSNNLQLVGDNNKLRETNKRLTQQLTAKTERLNKVKIAMEGYK